MSFYHPSLAIIISQSPNYPLRLPFQLSEISVFAPMSSYYPSLSPKALIIP